MSKNLLTDFLFLGYFRNCKNRKVTMSHRYLLSAQQDAVKARLASNILGIYGAWMPDFQLF